MLDCCLHLRRFIVYTQIVHYLWRNECMVFTFPWRLIVPLCLIHYWILIYGVRCELIVFRVKEKHFCLVCSQRHSVLVASIWEEIAKYFWVQCAPRRNVEA